MSDKTMTASDNNRRALIAEQVLITCRNHKDETGLLEPIYLGRNSGRECVIALEIADKVMTYLENNK